VQPTLGPGCPQPTLGPGCGILPQPPGGFEADVTSGGWAAAEPEWDWTTWEGGAETFEVEWLDEPEQEGAAAEDVATDADTGASATDYWHGNPY